MRVHLAVPYRDENGHDHKADTKANLPRDEALALIREGGAQAVGVVVDDDADDDAGDDQSSGQDDPTQPATPPVSTSKAAGEKAKATTKKEASDARS